MTGLCAYLTLNAQTGSNKTLTVDDFERCRLYSSVGIGVNFASYKGDNSKYVHNFYEGQFNVSIFKDGEPHDYCYVTYKYDQQPLYKTSR